MEFGSVHGSSARADYDWRLGNLRFGRLGRAPQRIVGVAAAILFGTNIVMQFSDRGPNQLWVHMSMTVISAVAAAAALWWGWRGNWPGYRQSLVFIASAQSMLTLVALSFSAWLASAMACITMSLLAWYIVMLHGGRVLAAQMSAATIVATACVIETVRANEVAIPGAIAIACMLLLALVLVPLTHFVVWTGIVRASWEAERDPLTRLFNYRGLLRNSMPLFVDGRPGEVAVVTADLDGFKAVNDTVGHAGGNDVLIAIGEQLMRARPRAVIARTGGEEFAVVERTSAHAVGAVAASVGAAIGAVELPGYGAMSASVGECIIDPGSSAVAGRRAIKRILDDGLRSADAVMYEAKRAGGKQIRSVGIARASTRSVAPRTVRLRDVLELLRDSGRREGETSARKRNVLDAYGLRPFTMTMAALFMTLWGFGHLQMQFYELGPGTVAGTVVLNVVSIGTLLLAPAVLCWRSPTSMPVSLACFIIADITVVVGALTLTSASAQLAACVSMLAVGAFLSIGHGIVPLLWHSVYAAFWICYFTVRLLVVGTRDPLYIDAASGLSTAVFLLVAIVGIPIATERLWTETSFAAEAAGQDGLTGLLNQRGLRSHFADVLRQVRRSESDLVVCMVDIDEFKAVNDSRGHRSGDELLRAVGARLIRAAGDDAIVSRLGGDEFVVVSGVERDRATAYVAELATGASRPADIEPVSVSIGYTVCREASSINRIADEQVAWLGEAVAAADRAMYRAKEASRTVTTVLEEANCPCRAPSVRSAGAVRR